MPRSNKDRIYTLLFNRIFDGEYGNNTRLKEEDLAREFGVSRTPIREVLQQLDQDGMLQLLPNRGATVKSLTADDVEELYEIRKKLEILALEFSVSSMNLQELSSLRVAMENSAASSDPEEIAEADKNIHSYLITASGKPRLVKMLDQVMRLMQRFLYIGFTDTSGNDRKLAIEEHLELIGALMHRDQARAAEILENHIDRSKKLAISFLVMHQKR